jgi:hypothetical protein
MGVIIMSSPASRSRQTAWPDLVLASLPLTYLASSSSSLAVMIRLTITIIRPTIIKVTPTPSSLDQSPSTTELVIMAEKTIRKPMRMKTTPK